MGTRDRILDAAAGLMRERGVTRTTTKEIAKAAGLSEAALYKHFTDKTELLLHVLRERMPGFARVDARPGDGSVAGTIAELTRATLDFYLQTLPMLGSLLAEPQLMAAQREAMRKYGAGPEHVVRRFADYLRAERDLGRIAADADPDAAGALLAGACFQQAFLKYFAEGPAAKPVPDETVTALSATLIRALGVRG
ncbi:TetR/AcrR family transcriptional regulator [Actinoallomurus purpureus]|uniref:TetR/AcrR family transcriptional regulator n=1 Tax=Actinoallomurus purpureus TaxID=478114 RepID=UPI002093E213|nr:TetR/AcrR family transcriptional regulator [Actinoallomurus purpureus]MCO6005808.1 TetR/AcrR family transcriptional regulator [Actinoallomurus purpureus]